MEPGLSQTPNPHAKGFSAVSMVPVLPPRGGRAQDGGGSFKPVALRRWDGQRGLDECEAKGEHGEWERSEKVRKVSEGRRGLEKRRESKLQGQAEELRR